MKFNNPQVRRDREYKSEPSRGWYIVGDDGIHYLTQEGSITLGTIGESNFWPSEESAKVFLAEWTDRKVYRAARQVEKALESAMVTDATRANIRILLDAVLKAPTA